MSVKMISSPYFLLSILGFLLCQGILGHAVDALADDVAVTEKSTFSTLKSKVRSAVWAEYMTPNYSSTQFPPSYAIAWLDYDIGKDFKVLYWQRSFIFANTPTGFQGVQFEVRNPRFALRKINVIQIPNLSSTYDLYVQPGLGNEANRGGRHIEVGFRTNHSYAIPHSKWSTGMTTEVTSATSFFSDLRGANLYGWVMPWFNYEINKTFSTQHYFAYNFQHYRTKPWNVISLDEPFPYIQNGVGINITDKVSTTLLINHSTLKPLALGNLWASLWMSWVLN